MIPSQLSRYGLVHHRQDNRVLQHQQGYKWPGRVAAPSPAHAKAARSSSKACCVGTPGLLQKAFSGAVPRGPVPRMRGK